jgi:hypothetical protein
VCLEPSSSPSQEATVSDIPSVPKSPNVVDLGNGELRLMGFP